MTTSAPTLTIASALSQDFITSDQIVVEGNATNQVAVFRNTHKAGAVEALVIPQAGSLQGLSYVAQDPSSTSGWRLTPLVDSSGSAIAAAEVVVCATTWGTVEAFYVDGAGALHTMTFDGTTWSTPSTVSEAPSGLTGLRLSYTPGATTSAGGVALYAMADSHLLFLYFGTDASGFAPTSTDLYQTFDSWVLSLLDTDGNFLFTATAGLSDAAGAYYWAKERIADLGSIYTMVTLHTVSNVPVGEMLFAATAMAGTSDRLMLMLDTTVAGSPPTKKLAWIINPDADDRTTGSLALPGVNLQHATVAESADGYCSVYGVDDHGNLIALHQVNWNRADMGSDFDGSQTWGPALAIAQRVGGVYADPMPGDAPALIAVDSDIGGLHLHQQDPQTGLWLTKPLRTESENTYELTRWRTKATAYSSDGQVLSGLTLAVAAASAVDVQVGDAYTVLDSETSTSLVTDSTGSVTVATLATSLGTPSLTFTLDAGVPHDHDPAHPINEWFAGAGTLPGMPAFSGGLLQTATLPDGRLLAPGLADASALDADQAAALMQQCAGLVSSASAGDTQVYVYSTLDDTPTTTTYADTAAAESAQNEHGFFGAVGDAVVKAWDAVWDFAGDVWDAIKSGFMRLGQVMVDVGKGVIRLVVWVGDQLVKLADLVIQTIEEALGAIVAVFKWIGAVIEDVIAFIRAIFDLGAIWRTKNAFAEAILGLPAMLQGAVGPLSAVFQDGVIAGLKHQVDDVFEQAIAHFDGGTIGGLEGYQDPGPPDDTTPVAGDATQADFSNDPSANWFSDQLKYTSGDPGDLPPADGDPLAALEQALSDVASDLTDIFDTFVQGFSALLDADDPASFGEVAITSLLRVAKDMVDSVLDLLDALIQASLVVMDAAMGAAITLLNMPLHMPLIGALYRFLARLAGYPDDELTLANFVALIFAFPVTVIYKLVQGADEEPFPDGTFPMPDLASLLPQPAGLEAVVVRAGPGLSGQQQGLGIVAGILSTLFGGLMMVADFWPKKTTMGKVLRAIGGAFLGLHLLLVLAVVADPTSLAGWTEFGAVLLLIGLVVAAIALAFGSKPTAAGMAVFQMIAGIVRLLLGLLLIVIGQKSVLGATAALLEPWPMICAPLDALKSLTLKVIKLVADGAGAVGGVCEVVDYTG